MRERLVGLGAVALLVLPACSTAVSTAAPDAPLLDADGDGSEPPSSAAPATATTTLPTTSTSEPATTTSTTTTTTSTTTSTTSTTTSTTTTTTLPPPNVYDPACVVQVQPGQGLLEIVEQFDDDTVDTETVIAENGLDSDQLEAMQLLDVCVDNGLDDIDGSTRGERNTALVAREVRAQQEQLNRLFAGYGIRELTVDGISGPVTRQRLCAFRLAAGLPVTLTDMEAGSDEEQLLMETETLPIPFTSALLAERWALIDETCQIMFVGTGTERLDFVFPTSTGARGETRPQTRSPVFRYNPASGNNGWHDSTLFPSSADNPLNGNMYKPLYFDGGLAIHGANNVPRSPASKGCARLRVEHQDLLIDWLGLGDQSRITTDRDRINLAVNVQGRYVGSG